MSERPYGFGLLRSAESIEDPIMTAPDTQPAPASGEGETLRESLRGSLAGVLCNVSNLPEPMQVPALGLDMGPLLDQLADAALAALGGEQAGDGGREGK